MTAHQPRRIRPHATPKPPKPQKQEPHGNALAVKAATLSYDYAAIPELHRELVQRAALDIRSRLRRTVEDMIEIGRQLNEVKALIPGRFDQWVTAEFGMSRATASEFRNAADRFAENVQNLYLLPVSVVRRLAAPSVPDEAVAAVIAEAKAQAAPLRYKDAMAIVRPYMPVKAPKPKQLAGPVAEPEPDAMASGPHTIDAEYTVVTEPPAEPVGDVVRLRHELLVKLIDGLAHKVFMPFLTREEHDELFVALAKGLGHE
jgi:hypothetical protein